jgi:glycosyltransferase involved in cell wall biosynthesis
MTNPAPDSVSRPSSESVVRSDAPRVCVVMTVYGDVRFLQTAIDSVLAQDFSDFELLVVDDGGHHDDVMASLAGCDPRIRIVMNEHNLGPAGAANRGIAASRAGIIVRLDADDIAKPTRVGRLVAALDADAALGLVGSWFETMTESGEPLELIRLPETDVEIRWCFLFCNPFCQSAVAFRRSCFEAAGGYRPELRTLEDYDLWARMLATCRAGNIPEPLARYRLNTGGLTSTHAKDWGATIDGLRGRHWSELGVAYDRMIAQDITTFVAGYEVSPIEARPAAYRTLLTLLHRFLEKPHPFRRKEDDKVARRLVHDSIKRMAGDQSLAFLDLMKVWRMAWRIHPAVALGITGAVAQRTLRKII